ncbi:MAG: hypothetical protein U5R31_16580 [Acidimicrobiia bacterium]|nr:hypothetical protein [Acidimicrobiia bacterium]
MAPGDDLAARTLLQMLLPGLVRLKATVGRADPDATHEFVALAWERIRTYPTTRQGSVAANVVLDVRKRYVKSRVPTDETAAAVPEVASPDPTPEDHLLSVAVLEDLVGAASSRCVERRRVGDDRPHPDRRRDARRRSRPNSTSTRKLISQRRWRGGTTPAANCRSRREAFDAVHRTL